MKETSHLSEQHEWLETDGLGGFASGTAIGTRTRRYHALLLSAATPPTGRQVLVAGLDAEVDNGNRRMAISSQRYSPGVIHPDGASRIETFHTDPWPQWTYRVDDGLAVEYSLFVPKGLPVVVLRWRAIGGQPLAPITLEVRPFIAGRDYHSTHHQNDVFRFHADGRQQHLTFAPYHGVQPIAVLSDGQYEARPEWYRNFEYPEEQARGLDSVEDLACPGVFRWDLSGGDAVLVIGAATSEVTTLFSSGSASHVADTLSRSERIRRGLFRDPLERSADAYPVRRGGGSTIIAGYPWFTDWGRDTFIALRGLCIATGRHAEALEILVAWAESVSEGMLPNRFPDAGETPEFNSVDASLWFIIAAHELLTSGVRIEPPQRGAIVGAIGAILDGYARGTRFGIHADTDGLLAAGVPGVQLTWMDARVGDRVITPRTGKPVEVQALWINALWVGAHFSDRWNDLFDLAYRTFGARFWNASLSVLYDVIDVDHVPGTVDASFRPNQIFAVGGLPLPLLDGQRARAVVDAVENRLLTPIGLRSLAPAEPGYSGRYAGGVEHRDGAYHQGTVWPWLMGPFVEAWVRTHAASASVLDEARTRFLDPLLARLDVVGLGHLPEVADGDPPHAPGGCPFQAWSLGEALRLDRVVLAAPLSTAIASSGQTAVTVAQKLS